MKNRDERIYYKSCARHGHVGRIGAWAELDARARLYVGVTACWRDGTLACWHVGALARRHVGASACWCVGAPACWCRRVGVLVCRHIGMLARWCVSTLASWCVRAFAHSRWDIRASGRLGVNYLWDGIRYCQDDKRSFCMRHMRVDFKLTS